MLLVNTAHQPGQARADIGVPKHAPSDARRDEGEGWTSTCSPAGAAAEGKAAGQAGRLRKVDTKDSGDRTSRYPGALRIAMPVGLASETALFFPLLWLTSPLPLPVNNRRLLQSKATP
jgi:hypothetical protein